MKVEDWGDYSPYFSEEEFKCKHTGLCEMDKEFMDKLLDLRVKFNKPMVINSGYRHWSHPVEARKGHKNGEHTKGRCADIRITNSRDRYHFLRLAFQMGFPRLGFHEGFIHIGLGGDGLPNDVFWDYK